jgi:hypothetical protein
MPYLRQSKKSVCVTSMLLLVVATFLCGNVAELSAQDRYNPNQPDFYTRPKVSPYVNMLNPLLGPNFMRYNFVKQEQDTRAGITSDRAALQEQQYQLEQQQKEIEQERNSRDRQTRMGQAGGGKGGLQDPRVGGPVRRSAHGGYSASRLKGHSYNTRSTGHPVRFNDKQVIGRVPRAGTR